MNAQQIIDSTKTAPHTREDLITNFYPEGIDWLSKLARGELNTH